MERSVEAGEGRPFRSTLEHSASPEPGAFLHVDARQGDDAAAQLGKRQGARMAGVEVLEPAIKSFLHDCTDAILHRGLSPLGEARGELRKER